MTSIGQYAFQKCSKLTTVNIPDGVTTIGQHAFEGCTLLTAINIPASVATIGDYVFQNCSSLTAVTIAEGVTSISGYAFQGCSELTEIVFPASVTRIGSYSFRNCSKLAKVYINAPSLETYGYNAFNNNAEGRKIYVPADALDTYKTKWSGYAADIEAMPYYTVTLKEGTEDADKWTITPAEATTTGVDAGTTVTATYSGTKRVKSVKAVVTGAAAPAGPVAINVTSPAVGQVIGSDGKNYAYASLPSGVTAVAKICYVSGDHGLALALTDEGRMNFGTAQTTCAAHTPAFTSGTWKLASKDEWNSMLDAAFGDFTSVGGNNLVKSGSDYYWSSSSAGGGSMWCIGMDVFGESDWMADSMDQGDVLVRACFAF